MKSWLILFVLLVVFTISAKSQENPLVMLKGIVRDHKSRRPLAAQIKIIYTDNQLVTQETNAKGDGVFEINILPKRCVMQAKIKGYIVSNVLMNLEKLPESRVFADIPLVFDGKPKINQFLLDFSAQKKEKNPEQSKRVLRNKQVFQAVDALENIPIAAQFRLVEVSKNTIINQSTSKETSVFDYDFTSLGHFLVEVMAEGYQKFLSQIDISTFDETIHQNTAKLIKKIAFLNLITKNENISSIQLFDDNNGTETKQALTKFGDIYLGQLQPGIHYKIIIRSSTRKEIIQEFVAAEGLNQILPFFEVKEQNQAFVTEKKVLDLTQKKLFFEQSSYLLNSESRQILEEISKLLISSPEVNIEIIGYTDNVGDARQNQYLSEFRAKVVSHFLFNKGISDSRIKIRGDGARKAENNTEYAKKQNRRVELKLSN